MIMVVCYCYLSLLTTHSNFVLLRFACTVSDCGVFTCMFADLMSQDLPLVFRQNHITEYGRMRIGLAILNGETAMLTE